MGRHFDDVEPEVTAEAEIAWDEVGFAEFDRGATILRNRDGDVLGEIHADAPVAPDLGEAATPRAEGLVNAGATDADLIGTFESPTIPERGERDEYGNFAQPLNRITRSQAESLAVPEITIAKGGGGGGGGVPKAKQRPMKPTRTAPEEDDTGLIDTPAGPYRVSGLTKGEWTWFDRHPTADREVLVALVERIANETADLAELRRLRAEPHKSKRVRIVHGLNENQQAVLDEYGSAARRALASHARGVDPKFVDLHDGVHAPPVKRGRAPAKIPPK
ncbi:MAG: hypothetical protein JWP44_4183 [Mucilaginibacter sp.]|nr:hypothetical protein [Mucilaginibacter sp.]